MKIQRYDLKACNEAACTCGIAKYDTGDYVEYCHILPLLNPWHDAEKEKPEYGETVLCKIDLKDGYPFFLIGFLTGLGWKLEIGSELPVEKWMHIPKNEGEEL